VRIIEIKCASCGSIYGVPRKEDLPKNVMSLRTSYCHQCDGNGEMVESYVYKQERNKSTYIHNDKQEILF